MLLAFLSFATLEVVDVAGNSAKLSLATAFPVEETLDPHDADHSSPQHLLWP